LNEFKIADKKQGAGVVRVWSMAQVVEHLPSKCEALSNKDKNFKRRNFTYYVNRKDAKLGLEQAKNQLIIQQFIW
jgi:hypothetical protein